MIAAAPLPGPPPIRPATTAIVQARAGPGLDDDSRTWWERLHAPEPIRGWAIADLYERLRREAAFHIRHRIRDLSEFPRSDIDDLATQAAGDALVALLRKLDDFRGDSQFWTWAKRFAALEAPVSIRRRMGHDRAAPARDPNRALVVADARDSPHDRAEVRELLQTVSDLMVDQLTARQRTVLIGVIDGSSTKALARELDSTPGAIYKSLHDARVKLSVAAGTSSDLADAR